MKNTETTHSLSSVAVASGHVGYTWDLKTDHLEWFGDWAVIFGDSCEVPPHNAETLSAMIYADDHPILFNESLATYDRTYRFKMAGGRLVFVYDHGSTVFESGRAVRQQGLLRLTNGTERRQPSWAHNAHERDMLTGRPNRSYMQAQITRLLNGPKELRQLSAYLVISIDKMAFVNEAVGPKLGDAVLCCVGDRLMEVIPTKTVLARVGGDMFGVLMPGMGQEAQALAERILQSFHDTALVSPAGNLHVTVTVGGVRMTDLEVEADALMVHAEQALRTARQRGRNQYIEYKVSAARAEKNRATLQTGSKVKYALQNNGLRLAYQPVIDTASGSPLFYEALIRMFDEDGTVIAAAEFMPVVEELGLALDLDHYVLKLVINELEAYPELCLAMNVSGLTAARTDWADHMQKILCQRPSVARRLTVEITETAAIMDVTETKRFIDVMKRLGCDVALDDFGAGYTSIRHLRTLAFSIMKIDRELLFNLVENKEQQHLVRMLISIARGLGLRTVAEGIETIEVANWLRQEQVDMMQGYYFGRPSLERPWAKTGDTMPPLVAGHAGAGMRSAATIV